MHQRPWRCPRESIEGHQKKELPDYHREVAYPCPSREVLDILHAHSSTFPQQNEVTVVDVIKGFEELGREMIVSDMLTIVLRALAKDKTETMFNLLIWGDSTPKW